MNIRQRGNIEDLVRIFLTLVHNKTRVIWREGNDRTMKYLETSKYCDRRQYREVICSKDICQTVRGVDMLKRDAAISVLWIIRLSG